MRRVNFQALPIQVLQEHAHEPGVAPGRKALGHHGPDLPVRLLLGQAVQDFPGHGREVHGLAVHLDAGDLAQAQDVVDERAHALGGPADAAQVVPAFRVQLVRVVLFENLAESVDGAQGLAQVVGHGVGEGLQLPVGGLQLGRARHHPLFQFGVELDDLLPGALALGDVLERTVHGQGPVAAGDQTRSCAPSAAPRPGGARRSRSP